MTDYIKLVELFRQLWSNETSRPITTREVNFAQAVRAAALEEAAVLVEDFNFVDEEFPSVVLARELRIMKESNRV